MTEEQLKAWANRVAMELYGFDDEMAGINVTLYKDFEKTPDGKRIGVRLRNMHDPGDEIHFTVIVTNDESVYRTTVGNCVGVKPAMIEGMSWNG